MFDLLVLDMSMPDINGIEVIRRVRVEWPALAILIMSEQSEAPAVSRALRAGATGCVAKDTDPETLNGAIRKLASGGQFVDPRHVDPLVFGPQSGDALPQELLADREFQVLQMLAHGKRVSEIADTFAISAKTISTHKFRLMKKLCIANNSELIRYSVRHGVLETTRLQAAWRRTSRPSPGSVKTTVRSARVDSTFEWRAMAGQRQGFGAGCCHSNRTAADTPPLARTGS
ncbi:DNA-binding NarL/FixJ family response regulator [Paraburkholderia sp. RAU2J]|nr:DNA-binding NarL/FixJ family response regulator [Paraburkholderia sp. RAU2J]